MTSTPLPRLIALNYFFMSFLTINLLHLRHQKFYYSRFFFISSCLNFTFALTLECRKICLLIKNFIRISSVLSDKDDKISVLFLQPNDYDYESLVSSFRVFALHLNHDLRLQREDTPHRRLFCSSINSIRMCKHIYHR